MFAENADMYGTEPSEPARFALDSFERASVRDVLELGAGQGRDTLACLAAGYRVAMAITASEARKNPFPLIEQVNDDHTPVEITSKRGDAVLIAIEDYRALEATAYLLRSPANVRRLVESLDQARSGSVQEHELDR